eukprot:jgi/Tetstr1/447550/TSEL_034929.t1
MSYGEEAVVEPTLEFFQADVKAPSTLLRELGTTLAQLTARDRVVDGDGTHCSGSGQRIAGQPTGSWGAAVRPDLLEPAQGGRVGAKSVSDEDDNLARGAEQRAKSGYEAVRPVSRVPGLFPLSTDLTNEYLKQDDRRQPAQEEYLWMSCFGAHMAALFVALDELLPYVPAANQVFTPYVARLLHGAGGDVVVVAVVGVAAKTLKSYAGRLSQFAELCHDSENISPLEATTAIVVRSSQEVPHSLRKGAASAANAIGAPLSHIRYQGGWDTTSDVVLDDIDPNVLPSHGSSSVTSRPSATSKSNKTPQR